MALLKVFELDGGTEFRIPKADGWDYSVDLRLDKSAETITKEVAERAVGTKAIVGDYKFYFRAAPKVGGVYQTKVAVFVATNLETNLSL